MKRAFIKIHRWKQDENQTSGTSTVLNHLNQPLFASLSLERGWRNNERNVSCYPAGTYLVMLEYSPRFNQMLWEVKGVVNRSECKFHSANYWYQLNGCTALGLRFKKLNSDNYQDLTFSKDTMNQFHQALKGYKEAVLHITTEPNVY